MAIEALGVEIVDYSLEQAALTTEAIRATAEGCEVISLQARGAGRG